MISMSLRLNKFSEGKYFNAFPVTSSYDQRDCCVTRLQNSLYFCVLKFAWTVKQKVWNEAENGERDWGETVQSQFLLASHAPHTPHGLRACEASALRPRKTPTPRFTDFFTDFEKKTDRLAVYCVTNS